MARNRKIRVLVVDDSALMRKVMTQILESDPEMEVIATARDGEDGVNKTRDLTPDVVTMDVNMPVMDGITSLQHIVSDGICPVVMVSSLTQEGAIATFEAMELGAFDYVPKPGGTISINLKKASDEIVAKVKAASKGGTLTRIRNRMKSVATAPGLSRLGDVSRRPREVCTTGRVRKAVVIGISTGGPKTLTEVIPRLPPDLDAALIIVQHMPPGFTETFAKRLDQTAQIPIKEAGAGEVLQNNTGYVAKGGYHLLFRTQNNGNVITRLAGTPEHLFMPSVGITMESAADAFGRRTIGVLMTGMGDDGADTMVTIREIGGTTIAESEETAIVFGMPKEAIDRGGAAIVAPSYKIADEIVNALRMME